MILIIAITVITCIAAYLLIKQEDEKKQFFKTDFLIGILLLGVCAVPSLILMSVFEHFNVLQEYQVIPITLPILTLGFLAVCATWGDSKSGNATDNKKDDFTAETIVLTAVLSENSNSNDSDSSSSSGSSSSSSSSSSNDFFIL
jgi:uncharacterized membrane protein